MQSALAQYTQVDTSENYKKFKSTLQALLDKGECLEDGTPVQKIINTLNCI